jgi:hypothetical protein
VLLDAAAPGSGWVRSRDVKSLFVHLAFFRLAASNSVRRPSLSLREILRNCPDAFFDILPFELKHPSIVSNAANCHMDVRVFGIVMRYGSPFELRSCSILLIIT